MQSKFTLGALLCLALPCTFVNAQTPISSATTTYKASTSGNVNYTVSGATNSSKSGTTYSVKYGSKAPGNNGNNNLQLNTFTAGARTYEYIGIPNAFVKMRRVNNGSVSGIRDLKFEEGALNDASGTMNIVNSYEDDMEIFYNGTTNFNAGTDNLFANDGSSNGDGNVNNIERLDVIFPDGFTPTNNSKFGFGIFERGDNGAHDPFKIAVILSLDASKNPSSYSTVKSVTSAQYGADLIATRTFVISRKDRNIDTRLRPSTTVNQSIGGVMLTIADFGIPEGTKIYGYSVLPNDFSGSSAHVVDYTNSNHYPDNSSANTGQGGIDLVAVTGISKDISVPLPLDLLSFNASLVNGYGMLQWNTGNEKNTSHFDVEHSTDGSSWKKIGTVKAGSEGSHQYSFLHKEPVAGTNYYRLLMADLDGSFHLSETRSIRLQATGKTGVYPNPAGERTRIFFARPLNQATVALYSANGSLVQQLSTSGTDAELDLRNLPAGIYQAVVVENGVVLQKERIVRQ